MLTLSSSGVWYSALPKTNQYYAKNPYGTKMLYQYKQIIIGDIQICNDLFKVTQLNESSRADTMSMYISYGTPNIDIILRLRVAV